MKSGYGDLPLDEMKKKLDEMKKEMDKPTPIFLHHSLENWVRWVCALTLANTVVMILLHTVFK